MLHIMATSDKDPTRVQALAQALDCWTEEDLQALAGITPTTAESWRKRGTGPAYAILGNRVLYPRTSVAEFLRTRVRERSKTHAVEAL